MKVTLKDGEQIECTVKEYLELKGEGLTSQKEEEPEKGSVQDDLGEIPSPSVPDEPEEPEQQEPQSTGQDVPKGQMNSSGKWYTYEEDEFIIANKDDINKILRHFPDRTKAAISMRLHKYRYAGVTDLDSFYSFMEKEGKKPEVWKTSIRKDWEISKKKKKSGFRKSSRGVSGTAKDKKAKEAKPEPKAETKEEPKPDNRTKRMRFINQKVKELCKGNLMSYDDAFMEAARQWNEFTKGKPIGKGTIQPKQEVVQVKSEDLEFPSVYPIAESAMHHLEETIRNMLVTNKRINYFDVNWMPLSDGKEWDGRLYRDQFVPQFMYNTGKITKAFGIPNKFRHEKDNKGFDIITYKGDVKQEVVRKK